MDHYLLRDLADASDRRLTAGLAALGKGALERLDFVSVNVKGGVNVKKLVDEMETSPTVAV